MSYLLVRASFRENTTFVLCGGLMNRRIGWKRIAIIIYCIISTLTIAYVAYSFIYAASFRKNFYKIRPIDRLMNPAEKEIFSSYVRLIYELKEPFRLDSFKITPEKIAVGIITPKVLNLMRNNSIFLTIKNVSNGKIFIFPFELSSSDYKVREGTVDSIDTYYFIPVPTGRTYLKELAPNSVYTQSIWILPKEYGDKIQFEVELYRIDNIRKQNDQTISESYEFLVSKKFVCNVR